MICATRIVRRPYMPCSDFFRVSLEHGHGPSWAPQLNRFGLWTRAGADPGPELTRGTCRTGRHAWSDSWAATPVTAPMTHDRQSAAGRLSRTVCESSNASPSQQESRLTLIDFNLPIACAPGPSPLAFGGWIQADPSKMDFCRVGSVAGSGLPGGSPPSGFPCTHFSAVRVRSQAVSERQAPVRFGRQGRGPSFSRPSPSVPGQSAVGCPYS